MIKSNLVSPSNPYPMNNLECSISIGKGEKGDAFTFEDFTPDQLELLKGEKGDKGDAFTYEDFTKEQLDLLKGENGKDFTFEDFTSEQLKLLKGDKGDKGQAFTYEDFTQDQLDLLKGDKGEKGDIGIQGDKGEKGANGLTTSITLNGVKHTHSNGNITLPDYPTKLSELENDIEIGGSTSPFTWAKLSASYTWSMLCGI